MARSPRTINAPSPTTSTPVQPSTPVAIPGASPAAHTPTTRTSARVRQPSALATSSLPPPITPAPAHHASSTIGTPADASSSKLPKTHVESKAHALRSVLGEKERTPCPYPSQYGGKEKCGVADDDERDEVLMAICAACAVMDNRALSADEIASSAIDQGWLRPPSAAVIPATIINNAIRAHQKRCSTSNPVRNMLLAKYQLTGSVNESVLESALHPTATEGGLRPKGTVWYLQPAGKSKWKNPFAGIEIPKVVPKKAAPARKMHREIKAKPSPANSAASADDRKGATTKARTKSMSTTMAKSASPAPTPTAAPVKIRLRLNGPSAVDVEESGEVNDSVGSSASGSRQSSVTPSISQPPLPTVKPVTRPARRSKNVLDDSSDESDTSDSDMDMDMDTGSSRLNKIPIRQRKDRPPPLPLNGSNHSRQHIPRPMGSPFIDWETGALSPSPTASASMTVPPHSSPFPSHSLDNTFWAVRHDIDRFAALETSSSSSDDDMRENGDWSMASSVLIRGADEVEDIKPVWSAQDEEAKVKEATDALRVLFPMSTPEEEEDYEPHRQLNRLDNRPTPSDSSSVNESIASSTTTKGQLKSADLAASIALAQWAGNSSPVPSPNLRFQHAQLIPDTSPTQHLSRLHNSFEASEMEIDDSGEPWLDESGELPVKAEDSFSDIDLGSTIGDIANTPEHDRQLNTAAWAMEAAASVVKQELPDEGDYPSPMPTELTVDDHTGSLLLGDGSRPGEHFRASRASSSDESHTPSSRSSELPPFEVDNSMSVVFRPNVEEVLVGPESVSVEELEDCWLPGMLPTEKTPQRGRLSKSRFQRGGNDARRCSGSWGGIGVGITPTPGSAIPFETILPTSQQMTPSRSKSSRISAKKRNHSPRTPIRPPTRSGAASLPTPPTDLDQGYADVENTEIREVDVDMDFEMDAIGTADLEAARAEAEAREEQHRKACREKAARRKELLEAYKLKVREGGETGTPNTAVTSPEAWEGVSPWSEMNTPHGGQSSAWGYSSTESINISTPGVLSPMALHSLSTLSLSGDATGYMCPKALISPPLRPSQQNASFGNTNAAHNFGGLVNGHAIMLDEVMSQAEVEAVMASVNSAPSSVKTVTPATVNTPVPIAPAKPPVPPGKPPGVTPAKNPKSDSNAATTRGPAKGPTLAPATAATPASRPNNVKASQTPSAAVPIASRKSTLQPPSKDQKPQSKPVSNTSSGSSSSLSSAPQSVSGANQPANAPKAPPAQQNGSANGPAPPQAKPYTAITKALCPGVDACVVDHIPVYAHHWENKAGTKYTLLRRLDTDFVNATSLLNALGVPPTKHADYLQAPSPRLASHHTVPSVMNGVPYSPGVAGVWVQLVEAREYARMLNLSDKTLLWNILREDLFELFAALANIKTPHAASGSFGLSFDVRAPPPRLSAATAPSTPSNDSASNSTSSLSASSGNSKSTPNLTLLSSSAPSGPGPVANGRMSALSKISPNTATHPVNGAAVNKGPLVRPAPATPPDGCPHPKRRRATIVGDMSPLAKLTNSTTPVTHTTPTGQPSATNDSNNAGAVQMKKPPARSTRASVGGAA